MLVQQRKEFSRSVRAGVCQPELVGTSIDVMKFYRLICILGIEKLKGFIDYWPEPLVYSYSSTSLHPGGLLEDPFPSQFEGRRDCPCHKATVNLSWLVGTSIDVMPINDRHYI